MLHSEIGQYSWYGFLNKPLGLIAAQERTSSEEIVFLDSDLLFLNEPDQLFLRDGEDFLFCCTDAIGGTTGQGDIQDSFWKTACSSVGLNIDDLPWLTTAEEGLKIRFYFNGGLMAYHPSTQFAEKYLATLLTLLDARIMSQQFGVFFHEQIAAALTVLRMGLTWRNLPQSHNYEISSDVFEKFYREERLKTACIVQYHDCMLPHFWPTFLDCLKRTHQPVENWLNLLGPVNEAIPYPRRLPNRILQSFRGRRHTRYLKGCQVI